MDVGNLYEQNTALIRAAKDKSGAEPWSDAYKKDSETFARLLKAEAKIQRVLNEYFSDQASRLNQFVDWFAYNTILKNVKAAEDNFQVDVIVQDLPDSEDGLLLRVLYDPLAAAVTAGVDAGQKIYLIPLDEVKTLEAIDRAAKSEIASLVGKKIDKAGNIIDNPKAEYQINDVTRDKIRQAIRLSLNLGEDQQTASGRVREAIYSKSRAEMIAQTEAVNGYQGGMYNYARTAGAIGKEWQGLIGACPRCLMNINAGVIGITEEFPTGHQRPSCHPRDRCGIRYVFPEQL